MNEATRCCRRSTRCCRQLKTAVNNHDLCACAHAAYARFAAQKDTCSTRPHERFAGEHAVQPGRAAVRACMQPCCPRKCLEGPFEQLLEMTVIFHRQEEIFAVQICTFLTVQFRRKVLPGRRILLTRNHTRVFALCCSFLLKLTHAPATAFAIYLGCVEMENRARAVAWGGCVVLVLCLAAWGSRAPESKRPTAFAAAMLWEGDPLHHELQDPAIRAYSRDHTLWDGRR